MRTGVLAPVNTSITSIELPTNSIAESSGIPVGVFILFLVTIVVFLVYKELKKPKIAIPTMKPRHTGIMHVLFEKR